MSGINKTMNVLYVYSVYRVLNVYIRGVFKKWLCIFKKQNYFFINIYVVPFKVIPLRYNTLMPTVFPILKELLISTFRYSLELFQRCSLYIFNRCKSSSFHRFLLFWKQEKVTWGQIRWIWWLRHDWQVLTKWSSLKVNLAISEQTSLTHVLCAKR